MDTLAAFEKWARDTWPETPERMEQILRRDRMGLVYEDSETQNNYVAWLAGFNHSRKLEGAPHAGEQEPQDAQARFEAVARPLIRYLAENHHPHTTVVATATDAELLEGAIAIHTHEYLKD